MRVVQVVLLCLFPFLAEAGSLSACSSAWRVGGKVIRVGDSVSRTLDTIQASRTPPRWVRGPRGQRWTLVESGRNARTVTIKLRNGRIQTLCQHLD